MQHHCRNCGLPLSHASLRQAPHIAPSTPRKMQHIGQSTDTCQPPKCFQCFTTGNCRSLSMGASNEELYSILKDIWSIAVEVIQRMSAIFTSNCKKCFHIYQRQSFSGKRSTTLQLEPSLLIIGSEKGSISTSIIASGISYTEISGCKYVSIYELSMMDAQNDSQ